MKILITGGTGFLGEQLLIQLLSENHDLILVTRQNPSKFVPFPGQIVPWPIPDTEHEKLKDVEAIIHLAGENVGEGRWTKERKIRIYDSRIQGTRHIVDLTRLMPKLRTFICASGIGYYGNNSTDDLDESSPPGQGFLAEVCRDWEAEAQKAARDGVRVVILRTGVVLGRNGGVLKKLEPFFRNNMGGPAGDGTQQMSWIHENDWVRAVLFCLYNPKIQGPVNLTAPEPVSNKAFSIEMARLFGQSMIIPAPAFALQLALGEMSSLALEGQRALPKKLLDHNFKFHYVDLGEAMRELYDVDEKNPIPDEFFTQWQWVRCPLEKTFAFFADEKHVEKIVPAHLHLRVTGKSTATMGVGTITKMEMTIHGFNLTWQSLMKVWDPPNRFVDEQYQGPYKRFQHERRYIPACGGTIIIDRVLYRLPGGKIGRLGGKWLSDHDFANSFNERKKRIAEILSDES